MRRALSRHDLKLAWICSLAGMALPQAYPQQLHEQLLFSAEDEGVKKPVSVPDDVLSLLAREEFVRSAMGDSPLKAPPQDWFSASVIHLAGTKEQDLIVQARRPLSGANVDTFWVIRRTPDGPVVVLTAQAHDLQVMKTRWKGFRNIELFSTTAVECSTVQLRFSGSKYEEYSSKSGPIPHC